MSFCCTWEKLCRNVEVLRETAVVCVVSALNKWTKALTGTPPVRLFFYVSIVTFPSFSLQLISAYFIVFLFLSPLFFFFIYCLWMLSAGSEPQTEKQVERVSTLSLVKRDTALFLRDFRQGASNWIHSLLDSNRGSAAPSTAPETPPDTTDTRVAGVYLCECEGVLWSGNIRQRCGWLSCFKVSFQIGLWSLLCAGATTERYVCNPFSLLWSLFRD